MKLFLMNLILIFANFFNANSEPIYFSYSTQSYFNNDSTSLVELNFQFSETGLKYINYGSDKIATLVIQFEINDFNGKNILKEIWSNKNTFIEKPEPDFLCGVKIFTVKPGSYNAMIKYIDSNNIRNSDSANFKLNVRDYSNKKINISDIQIANEISPTSNADNIFYKNGFLVIPNIESYISTPFLVLNSYCEIYNANQSSTYEYSLVYSLADSTGKVFYKKESKNIRPKESGITEVNSLQMEEVPSGKYFLIINVFNGLIGSATDSVRVIKPYFVFNPVKDSIIKNERKKIEKIQSVIQEINPLFVGKTEKELDLDFKKIKYIASKSEIQIWNNISGREPKEKYLTNFWAKRDQSPETPENEDMRIYYKHLSECKLYSCAFYQEGWESDRGKIFLTYGKPDNIERHYSELEHRPYEIWTYLNNNWQFIFVDRSQTGTFPLKHSTHPNEIKNENWFEREVNINTKN
jgi:GWxTD domain-containing protein